MSGATNYSNVGFSTNLATFPLKKTTASGSNGIGWLQAHETREKLERMVARRAIPLGDCNWPPASHTWVGGNGGAPFVTTVTNNGDGTITFAVSGVTWHGGTDDVSGNTYANPWAGVIAHSPTTDFIPTNWHVLIDDPLFDWTRCIGAVTINSWTNTGTITCSAKPFLDAVQCCVIPSLSYLVGKPLVVIARDALWRSDRVLEFPNDPQFATGNIVTLAANTNVTPALPATPTLVAGPGTNHTLIFRATNVGSFTNLAGMDLRTTDTAGYVRSWTFTSSNTAAVGYAIGAGTANANTGSAFTVVHHGARAYPGRPPSFPYWAYRGIVGSYATHDFQLEGLSGASMPLKTAKVDTELPGPICGFTNQQVYDFDYQTTYDGSEDPNSYTDCGRPYDHIFAVDFHKSIHGLQVDVLAFGTGYTEDRDWTGLEAVTVPNLNPAEQARVAATNLAGITGVAQTLDLFSLSTGSLVNSGEINVTGSGTNVLPYLPIGAWYSIHKADGSYNGGYGFFGTNGTLVAGPVGPGNGTGSFGTNDASCTILVWPGFSLFIRNQVRGLADQPGAFIADVVTPNVGAPFAQDPPSPVSYTSSGSFGVGQFVPRHKSAHATDRLTYTADPGDVQGFAREGGNTNTALVVGGLYRWNGDAFFAPSVKASEAGSFLLADDPQAPYYENFWNGRRSDAHQAQVDALRSGTISAGGTNWLRAPTCDTFNFPTPSGAAMLLHTNSGTVTSGSATSFADSTVGNVTNPASAYFAAIRFPGFGGSFVTFGVEFDFGTGTNRTLFLPDHAEARQLATGGTNASGTWLTATTNGSTAGVPWRIREPRILHPWYGRRMLLTGTNGTQYTVTNKGSCGDVQFFDAGTNSVTVTAGWSMQIGSPFSTNPADDRPGQVMRYHGTAAADVWTVASGTDTTRLGVPVTARDFTANGYYNLEGYSKRYGHFIEGAAVCPELLNEIWAMAKALRDVRLGSGSYTAKSSGTATPINNSIHWGTGSAYGGQAVDCGSVNAVITCDTGDPFVPSGGGGSDMEAYAAAHSSSTSTEGLTPFAQTTILIGDDTLGCSVSSDTGASYIKVTGVKTCRDVLDPVSVAFYIFATRDSSGTSPSSIAGSCTTGTPPDEFVSNYTPAIFEKWSLTGTGSSSDGTAYSGLIGSTSAPSWPATITCTPTNLCTPSNPNGDVPTGGGSGGWWAHDNLAIAKYGAIFDVLDDT